MSHRGGGEGVRKAPKKCHVLFEWTLSDNLLVEGLLDCAPEIVIALRQWCPTAFFQSPHLWRRQRLYCCQFCKILEKYCLFTIPNLCLNYHLSPHLSICRNMLRMASRLDTTALRQWIPRS